MSNITEKVIEYIVKCDGDFDKAFASLGKARQYVRDLPVIKGIDNMPKVVHIIKSITLFKTMNEYIVKPTIVLEPTRIFDDVDLA